MKQNQNNLGPILAGIVTSLLCLGIIGGTLYVGIQYFKNRPVIPTDVPTTLEAVKAVCADGECIAGCVLKAANTVGYEKYPPVMADGYESELVTYKVDGDELLDPSYPRVSTKLIVYQRNGSAHHRIWDYFSGIVPLEQRPNLSEFVIYSGGESGAQFSPTADGGWSLHVNVLEATDPEYLTHALVHEFGHYITLNPTQQTGLTGNQTCAQEELYNCPNPDSYVNQFFEAYWRPIYKEWQSMKGASNRDRLALQFYKKYSDQFVTDYASSQPLEDIAETWTAFILSPKPTGDTIADQKVLFFYQFPELMEIRYEIMYGICNYAPPKK